jgi:hydrogenase maturation protease
MTRVLVIGYGNPGRQDDGLGPAAALRIGSLGWPNLKAFDGYQLNIEDALDVAAHDVVWFVDAAKSGEAPYEVRGVAPSATVEFTSHILRPEAVLAIAREYCGASPKAFLLAIRGYAFEFVEALTPAADDNLRAAVAMLSERIRAGAQDLAP